jgi:glycosyltransferase 2 family protein
MSASHPRRKQVVLAVFAGLLLIGVYGILPQLGSFGDSIAILEEANLATVMLAALVGMCTVVFASILYRLLALHTIKLVPTFAVQLGGLCINRLLPAGVGGLGLNYLYLRRQRHSKAEAALVVTGNNLVGFVGHGALLLLILLLGAPVTFSGFTAPDISAWMITICLGLVLAIAYLVKRWWLPTVAAFLKELRAGLKAYRKRIGRLPGALLASCGITLSNAICLLLCCTALSVSVSFTEVFILLTIGVAAASATPTPGGIGGAEASITAGLLAFGVSASAALACALLFRLVTFWLGLAVGAIAVIYIKRSQLVSLSL